MGEQTQLLIDIISTVDAHIISWLLLQVDVSKTKYIYNGIPLEGKIHTGIVGE